MPGGILKMAMVMTETTARHREAAVRPKPQPAASRTWWTLKASFLIWPVKCSSIMKCTTAERNKVKPLALVGKSPHWVGI